MERARGARLARLAGCARRDALRDARVHDHGDGGRDAADAAGARGDAGAARGGRGGARARRARARRGRAGRRVPARAAVAAQGRRVAARCRDRGARRRRRGGAGARGRAQCHDPGDVAGGRRARGHRGARARPGCDVRMGRTAPEPRRARAAPGVGAPRVGGRAGRRGGVPGGADVPDDAAIPGRDDALVHRRGVRRADRVVAGDVVRERQPGRARPRPRARRRLRAVRRHHDRIAAPAAPSRAGRDDGVLAARDGLRARGVRRVGGAARRAERAALRSRSRSASWRSPGSRCR